jgi:hypothetical protein
MVSEEPFDVAQDKLRDEESKILDSTPFRLGRTISTTKSAVGQGHSSEELDLYAIALGPER